MVLLSLLVHGGTPMAMAGAARRAGRGRGLGVGDWEATTSPQRLAPYSPSDPSPLPDSNPQSLIPDPQSDRISIAQLRQLWERGELVVIIDATTERSYNRESLQASGALRLQPDHVAERAAELGLPREAWIVAYCT